MASPFSRLGLAQFPRKRHRTTRKVSRFGWHLSGFGWHLFRNVDLALGFLWRATERWRVGGFARSGFDVPGQWDGWPGPAASPDNPREWHFSGTWQFPPVLGLGCAYTSPSRHLTVSFEWDYVVYSSILEGDPDEAIPDAHELHLGGEYAFLRSHPVLALRLGVWLDPDHRIRATTEDDLFRAVLSPGSDNLHYAFGFGAAFKRIQIDLGADFSDLRDTPLAVGDLLVLIATSRPGRDDLQNRGCTPCRNPPCTDSADQILLRPECAEPLVRI